MVNTITQTSYKLYQIDLNAKTPSRKGLIFCVLASRVETEDRL